jgi:hypothetical protein
MVVFVCDTSIERRDANDEDTHHLRNARMERYELAMLLGCIAASIFHDMSSYHLREGALYGESVIVAS